MGKKNWSVLGLLLGCCFGSQGQCASIPLDEPKQDAALGVRITARSEVRTAPPGMLETLGIGETFLDAFPDARYYSGSAAFKSPIEEITFDVRRLTDSGLEDNFTLAAFDKGKRIRVMTIDLNPFGEDTDITLQASEIKRLSWHGQGWALHSYLVEDISEQPAGGGSSSDIPPAVTSPLQTPEPVATTILFVFFPVMLLLQRQRRPLGSEFR